jgi:hypothetical protein
VVNHPIAFRLLGACLVVLAGACTPMRWEHPQLGLASAEADAQECDHLARRESWRSPYGLGLWDSPSAYRGPDGRFRAHPYPLYRRDPWFEELRLRDYCMRAKGYRLVPAPG